jgi:hypothetical protein
MKLIPKILLVVLVLPLSRVFGADMDAQVLSRSLKDLYVLHQPVESTAEEAENFLEIVLTLNSYQGKLGVWEVLETEKKYVIFIGDENLNIVKTFAFYFGGPSQFALQVTGERNPFVGKVGEYVKSDLLKAYVGLRADPAFYDKRGYRGFFDDRCAPVNGFRCERAGVAENFFQNKNVLALALSINLKYLLRVDGSRPKKFSVWAKAYKRNG